MPARVVLFSQPDCPPCSALKKFLEDRGVAFEELGVSADPRAAAEVTQKYQSRSTPTLVVGEQAMIGFDPERLEKILG